jgi:hypothetical protein
MGVLMVAAKCFLNLVQCSNAFVTGLPIPEHDESLPADTTVGLRVAICLLAKYLHADLYGDSRESQTQPNGLQIAVGYTIPVIAIASGSEPAQKETIVRIRQV